MKATKKLPWIVALGAVVLAMAWGYRHKVEATRIRPALVLDPRLKTLQLQSQKLQAAVAGNPRDSNSRWQLADAYQELGQPDRAAEQLRLIVRQEPENQTAHLTLANTDLALKHLDAANQDYQVITRRWPKNAEAWQGLTAVLFHQGHFLEATEAARQTVAIQPKSPANHYLLARALLDYALQFPTAVDVGMYSNELREARAELEKVIARPQQSGALYYGDAHYQLGRVYIGLRDAKSAIKALQRAQKLLPGRPDIAVQLAKVYKGSGQNPEALQVVAQALPKNPQSAALYDLQGQLRQNSGDPQAVQQAYDAFAKAVQLAPKDPTIQERFGIACLRLNKFEEARAAFEKSVNLNPNRAFPYQQLAAIYSRQGKPDLATKFAKNSTIMVFNDRQLKQIMGVSAEHPDSVPLHLILADRYLALDYLGAARDQYLTAHQLDPGNQRASGGIAAAERAQAKRQSTTNAPVVP